MVSKKKQMYRVEIGGIEVRIPKEDLTIIGTDIPLTDKQIKALEKRGIIRKVREVVEYNGKIHKKDR